MTSGSTRMGAPVSRARLRMSLGRASSSRVPAGPSTTATPKKVPSSRRVTLASVRRLPVACSSEVMNW